MAAGHIPTARTDWERNCTETHQTEELKEVPDEETGKDSKLRPLSESKPKNTFKMVKGKISTENTKKTFTWLADVENHCYTPMTFQSFWEY